MEYIIYILVVSNINKYKYKLTVFDIINESKNIRYGIYNFTPILVYRICIHLNRLNIIEFIRDNKSIYILPTLEEL